MKAPQYKAILRQLLWATDDTSVILHYKNKAMVQDKLKNMGWEPLMAESYTQEQEDFARTEDNSVEVETTAQTVITVNP